MLLGSLHRRGDVFLSWPAVCLRIQRKMIEPVAADDATVKLVDILTGTTAPTEEDEDEADVKEDDDANVEDDDDMTDEEDEGPKSPKPLNDDVGDNKKEDSVLVINRSAAPLRTYPWMTEPE